MALMCIGPDFICVWYTVIWSWLNDKIKKEEGEQWRGCKSSFIAGILPFHLIWNGCVEKRAGIKIQREFRTDETLCSYIYSHHPGSIWLSSNGSYEYYMCHYLQYFYNDQTNCLVKLFTAGLFGFVTVYQIIICSCCSHCHIFSEMMACLLKKQLVMVSLLCH